jgi:four helix bundle protein
MFQPAQSQPGQLEHERLIAYQKAYQLLELIESLGSLPGESDLRNQLNRAAASILLNIAEGASRQSPPDKRRFYLFARGSLGEVGAAIDVLKIRHRIAPARHTELRSQLVEIAKLLCGLCRERPD